MKLDNIVIENRLRRFANIEVGTLLIPQKTILHSWEKWGDPIHKETAQVLVAVTVRTAGLSNS